MRRKIILSLLFLSISTLAATAIAIEYVAASFLRKEAFEHVVALAEAREGHLYEFFERASGRVVDFSTDGFIRQSVSAFATEPSPELSEALSSYLVTYKKPLDNTILGINIIDLQGKVIATTEQSEIGHDEYDDIYFEEAKNLPYGKTYVSDALISHFSAVEEAVLAVSAPLYDVSGINPTGVIVHYIPLTVMQDILTGIRQESLGAVSGTHGKKETLDLYLVNKKGVMITSSRFYEGELLQQHVSVPLVQDCANGIEGIDIYENYRGARVIGASMCITKSGWTLLTEIEEKEAFALVSNLRLIILVILLIALLLAAVISLRLSEMIARPVTALARVAEAFKRDQLQVRAKVESNDEIGDLAQTFNNMADAITAHIHHLQEKEEKFHSVFNSATDAVVSADASGTIVEWNVAAERIFGYARKEAMGKSLDIIVPEVYRSRHQNGMERVVKTGKTKMIGKVVEMTGLRKDGTQVPVQLSLAQWKFEGKLYFTGIIRDITEKKKSDELRDNFISIASHQLKTPINALRWTAEMLLEESDGKVSKEQKDFIADIHNRTTQLNELVNMLLGMARLQAGKLIQSVKPVQMMDEIAFVLDKLQPIVEEKGLKVYVEKPKKLIPSIDFESEMLHQVLTNLLTNALNYTPAGGKVHVRVLEEEKEIVVSVEDTGIGIPKDEQTHIFERFYRATNAKERITDGTGLGLSFARELVQTWGGRIWFESEVEKGTIFHFSLPKSGMQKPQNGETV